MLLLIQKINLCPDYPTLSGQEMKIALISWKPFTFVQPDGSLKGFDHDSIELLSELIHFLPKYQLIPTWDEAFLMVQNGSIDTAAKASMSPKRYSMVDMAVSSNFVEVTYGVQVPQPVDVLYQFLQPFKMTVWITWFVILVVFTIIIFFATRLAIWKKRQQVQRWELYYVRRIAVECSRLPLSMPISLVFLNQILRYRVSLQACLSIFE